MCVLFCTYEDRCLWMPEVLDPSGSRDTDICHSPYEGTGIRN